MSGARTLCFMIPGRVGGKGRPRFTVIGGHARAYTPPKTASIEQMVRGFGAAAMTGKELFEGPLHLSIAISLERPASWSKRKRAENPIPTGKPDLDNVLKLIGDAFNGIIWRDDSQIASIMVTRQFVTDGERTEIVVRCMSTELAVAA
jgi:Holliday junction resolvase RusA-like endonuclease